MDERCLLIKNGRGVRNLPKPIEAKELAGLLDAYSASLELYASQWTRTPEDCVQEAFVELASQLDCPQNPVGWLFRVVRNRALNASRAQKRRTNHEYNAAKPQRLIDDPSATLGAADENARLLRTLDLLAESDRELIVLRIWSGLTWEQIAELTSCSSSSAQRNYQSALEKLKKLLEVPCLTKQD